MHKAIALLFEGEQVDYTLKIEEEETNVKKTLITTPSMMAMKRTLKQGRHLCLRTIKSVGFLLF